MTFPDFETEDVALLSAVAIATLVAVVDAFYGSPLFKALKIISLFLSLGLAWHRVKTSKPFYVDVASSEWIPTGQIYETRIGRSAHGRGKFPHARCLVRGDAGGFTECMTDAEVTADGEIVIQLNTPADIRVEVRK